MKNRSVWLALALILGACTNDNNNTPSAPTLDAAFVGYSNPATQQTTCGNCHVDRQRSWSRTGHARAWADLQNSGHAASYCNNCHTTNGSSNLAPDSAGYTSVADNAKPYYQDVQCESCHGPGAGHISSPDASQPLTTVHADTASNFGCGTCHTGTHDPFVDQWRASRHGSVESAANGNAACAGCHSAQGALARFAPTANYLEKNSSTWEPITCAVCHDPHGNKDNPSELRYAVNSPSIETNLCMQCHQRRSVPDPTSSRGAHSPQGPMVLGDAGYIPPNFQFDATQAAATHGSSANPGLCATCHMEAFDVTDKLTGAFKLHSTGHSFKAIPCVDSTGIPTGAANCPDTERRFNACASGGCHISSSQAMTDRQVLRGVLQNQVRQLWIDVNNNGVLDPFPTDSGLLAIVKKTTPGDFSTTGAGATTITVGEGVWFNADLIQRADGSYGVHNPIYAQALLLGSLQALRAQYTYLPAPPAGVVAQENAKLRALGVRRP